jgi:hypothetical protein
MWTHLAGDLHPTVWQLTERCAVIGSHDRDRDRQCLSEQVLRLGSLHRPLSEFGDCFCDSRSPLRGPL